MTHTRLVSHSGGQFPGTFYRLVPELGGENNAVLVLNTHSVSCTPFLSVSKYFNRKLNTNTHHSAVEARETDQSRKWSARATTRATVLPERSMHTYQTDSQKNADGAPSELPTDALRLGVDEAEATHYVSRGSCLTERNNDQISDVVTDWHARWIARV